jgi:hypothetical protein
MSRIYWLTRPDEKPLTHSEVRGILREEASHILRNSRGVDVGFRRSRPRTSRGYAGSAPRPTPQLEAVDGRSFVYVIGCDGHPVKVGTARDVVQRVKELQTGFPFDLRIYGTVEIEASAARHLERAAHKALSKHRLRGEWFQVSPATALDTVERIAADWSSKVRSVA